LVVIYYPLFTTPTLPSTVSGDLKIDV